MSRRIFIDKKRWKGTIKDFKFKKVSKYARDKKI